MADAFDAAFPDVSNWAEVLHAPEERYDAMAAADLALACSGTVTSELAMQGTPMIVAYRTGLADLGACARTALQETPHHAC
jgi:lipid-A-disaccharide synthase